MCRGCTAPEPAVHLAVMLRPGIDMKIPSARESGRVSEMPGQKNLDQEPQDSLNSSPSFSNRRAAGIAVTRADPENASPFSVARAPHWA